MKSICNESRAKEIALFCCGKKAVDVKAGAAANGNLVLPDATDMNGSNEPLTTKFDP